MDDDRGRAVSFPENGIGFGYDKAIPSEESVEIFRDTVLKKLQDSPDEIHIWAYASQPGSEEYNQALSVDRAEAAAKLLRENGIDEARLHIHAMGESPRFARLAEAVEKDEPADRVVIFDLQKPKEAIPAGALPHAPESVEGLEIFKELVDPEADFIRGLVEGPDNPIMQDPTGDPVKDIGELGQFLGVPDIFSISENLWSLAERGSEKNITTFLTPGPAMWGKLIVGSLINLANAGQADEIKKGRMPLFEAAAAGLAAGLDPEYRHSGMQDFSALQMQLFESLKGKASDLSAAEKDDLSFHLIKANKGLVADGFSDQRWGMLLAHPGANVFAGAMGKFHFGEYSTNSSRIDELSAEFDPDPDEPQEATDEAALEDAEGGVCGLADDEPGVDMTAPPAAGTTAALDAQGNDALDMTLSAEFDPDPDEPQQATDEAASEDAEGGVCGLADDEPNIGAQDDGTNSVSVPDNDESARGDDGDAADVGLGE